MSALHGPHPCAAAGGEKRSPLPVVPRGGSSRHPPALSGARDSHGPMHLTTGTDP